MLRSWKLGRALGVPIYVHPTFLLLVGLAIHGGPPGPMGWLLSTGLLFAVFCCVLLHELGHALMARHFGIHTSDITLYPIGGVARLERFHDSPREEFCIALAGPAVNLGIVLLLVPFLLALVALNGQMGMGVLSSPGPLSVATQSVATLASCNAMLMFFNLAPAFPMDGGRVFRAVLSPSLGSVRATRIAVGLGTFLAGALAAWAIYSGQPLLAILASFVALAGQQELLVVKRREQVRLEMAAAPACRE